MAYLLITASGMVLDYPRQCLLSGITVRMSAELAIWGGQGREEAQEPSTGQAGGSELTPAQLQLRQMVLASVTSPHSRRNYAKALDLLFAFAAGRPLTRALLMEYRASMDALAPSTVNVRLAADPQAGHRGAQERHALGRGSRQPDRRPERPAEGNPARELVDEGAGQGTAGRSGPLDPEGQARLRHPRSPGRLRPPEKGTGLAHL